MIAHQPTVRMKRNSIHIYFGIDCYKMTWHLHSRKKERANHTNTHAHAHAHKIKRIFFILFYFLVEPNRMRLTTQIKRKINIDVQTSGTFDTNQLGQSIFTRLPLIYCFISPTCQAIFYVQNRNSEQKKRNKES